MARQTTDTVLLIRPAAFGWNAETAASNRFQRRLEGDVAAAARREFDGVVDALVRAGLSPVVVEDDPEPPRPDAVFPNNWVGFHPGGVVATYPMEAVARRRERREAVIDAVKAATAFVERRRLDLTGHEAEGRFLEGTGSLVLDHVGRVAYAVRSSRTDPELVRVWARELGYEPVLFDAAGPDGAPVYHTNVVLSIGEGWAAAAIGSAPEDQRAGLVERLSRDRELVLLDAGAVAGFAGNLLQVGDRLLGSTAAFAALPTGALALLERYADPLPVPIPTIEAVGGGSVRCMLAEVFLPDR